MKKDMNLENVIDQIDVRIGLDRNMHNEGPKVHLQLLKREQYMVVVFSFGVVRTRCKK